MRIPAADADTQEPAPDAVPTAGSVLEAAHAWLAQDPDPQTRAELQPLLDEAEAGDAGALRDLHDRFGARLAFGTAGLRGELGAGSNRMNRVLVAQAAAGLAAFVRERAGLAPFAGSLDATGPSGSPGSLDAVGPSGSPGSLDPTRPSGSPGSLGPAPTGPTGSPDGTGAPIVDDAPIVVVGYDGRRNSDVFARDSAELFAGAGLRAILLPRLLPTPVLAFAVRHLGAAAGVMVTASHNPPNDNGYKVYLGGADEGSQIVAPADAEIAARILQVADAGDVGSLPRSAAYEIAPEALVDAYVAATAAVAPAPAGARGLRWVYTAMHGVGWETLSRILDLAGYPAPVPVTAQLEPDGSFPTVAFPNPEEPGAMDLAFETARDAGAELVIANDPDADRLAVAIPDAAASGGWRRLTGNEIGLLLGWRAAQRAAGAADAGATGATHAGDATGVRTSEPVGGAADATDRRADATDRRAVAANAVADAGTTRAASANTAGAVADAAGAVTDAADGPADAANPVAGAAGARATRSADSVAADAGAAVAAKAGASDAVADAADDVAGAANPVGNAADATDAVADAGATRATDAGAAGAADAANPVVNAADATDAVADAGATRATDHGAAGATGGASLACSLVSSPGLKAVADHYGLGFHATLTGFKWISRAPGMVYGFEEALGYLVNPQTVRDKDGVSAAVAMLGMVSEARGRGATLADLLREFDDTFGAFASDQVSIRVDDVSQIARIMAALRERHPESVGGVAVERVDDLLDGTGDLPPGDVLRLWLVDGSRVIVRPSGTEPKLKLYLDVRGDSRDDAATRVAALAAGARALLAEYDG